jgi:O-antigen ligase
MKKFSQIDWRLRFLQLTIILIPFSYQPRIFFSSLQGLNLELSLVQISAAIFIALSLPSAFRRLAALSSELALRLFALFVVFNWLSILWSADATRTVVIAVYWAFLFLLVVSICALFGEQKIHRKEITNPLILGAVTGALFGWFQYLGVTFGLSDNITLIREAYTAELFGFPRIQAFALEPQFYANSLIAPIAYLSWKFLFDRYKTIHMILLAILVATFLLTVSRGGTLGLAATILVLAIWYVHTQKLATTALKRLLQLFGIFFAGFALSIAAVYMSASFQTKHTAFASVETFVDQMSHGIIDIRIANEGQGVDGLVEASTSGRLYMVERALEIVSMSQSNYIIGIGAGSFGPVFQSKFNGDISNHVTNNQYIEILTELGTIGLVLFLAFLASFAQTVRQRTKPYQVLLLAILLAYMIQYLFFSLQTNVLHIWLFVGVALGVAQQFQHKKSSGKLGAK